MNWILKQSRWVFWALVLAVMTGCAAYRTDSDLEFPSTLVESPSIDVVISEGALEDHQYTIIGLIEATVKKLTVFHKDPTREQVDIVLSTKAKQMGADAVINVVYKEGIGFATWGYMKATGTAVKKGG